MAYRKAAPFLSGTLRDHYPLPVVKKQEPQKARALLAFQEASFAVPPIESNAPSLYARRYIQQASSSRTWARGT